MWALNLNDMRSSNVEILSPVCVADTKEDLKSFVQDQVVEPYTTDGRWNKVFKQGGPLEWFNAPYDFEDHLHFVPLKSEEQVMREYKEWLDEFPKVEELK